MTSTEQLKLSAGVYNIVLTFGPPGFDGRLLTDGEGYVTISPPNEVPDPRQEVIRRFSDLLDYLLTCRFSGWSPLSRIKRTFSSSSAPMTGHDHLYTFTLLTKALPLNHPRKVTRSR